MRIKNIPCDVTRNMLVDLLNDFGFKGHYDFVYLVYDFTSKSNRGYAFVNFGRHKKAVEAMHTLSGLRNERWKVQGSEKISETDWGRVSRSISQLTTSALTNSHDAKTCLRTNKEGIDEC